MLPNKYPIPAQDCIHIAATKTSHLLLKNDFNFSIEAKLSVGLTLFVFLEFGFVLIKGLIFLFVFVGLCIMKQKIWTGNCNGEQGKAGW